MHPILVQAGPFTVGTHDAFSLLAVVVGFAIYWAELRRRGWLEERIVLVSLAVLVGGVIGARVITAWERVDEYEAAIGAGLPVSWVLIHGGKSLLGALAGGFLAGALAKRALGYTRSTGDAYVLAIPIATAIGRVGCYLSELPLGTPTTCRGASASTPRRPRPSRAAPAATWRCTRRCSTRSRSTWPSSRSSSGCARGCRSRATC